MFVVNMTFISSSEVKKYIFHSCRKLHNNVYEYTFYGLHMHFTQVVVRSDIIYAESRIQSYRRVDVKVDYVLKKEPLKPIDRFGEMDTLTKYFSSIWKRVYSETK